MTHQLKSRATTARIVSHSGNVGVLSVVEARLKADGHFARMLHVDLAYHSRYMIGISDTYKSLLDRDFQSMPFSQGHIVMFSSVFGRELDRATDSTYWQVRTFRSNLNC